MPRTIKKYTSNEDTPWVIPEPFSVQLMAINGVVYVSLDDTVDLSELHEDFVLENVDLSDADLLHTLRSESMPCRIINQRVKEEIAASYSATDEIQAMRENDTVYNTFIAGVLTPARVEKDNLGLVVPE
jgi:hypothetical protein